MYILLHADGEVLEAVALRDVADGPVVVPVGQAQLELAVELAVEALYDVVVAGGYGGIVRGTTFLGRYYVESGKEIYFL